MCQVLPGTASINECVRTNMKDNGKLNSKMINRNWVLKRKRGKLPHGSDTSNGKKTNSVPSESPENASSIHELKSEITSTRSSRKKKGNDGVSYLFILFLYFVSPSLTRNKRKDK